MNNLQNKTTYINILSNKWNEMKKIKPYRIICKFSRVVLDWKSSWTIFRSVHKTVHVHTPISRGKQDVVDIQRNDRMHNTSADLALYVSVDWLLLPKIFDVLAQGIRCNRQKNPLIVYSGHLKLITHKCINISSDKRPACT